MAWWSRTPKAPKEAKPYWVSEIRRDVLELIFASGRSQHPREFGAVLRAQKGVITDILLLPGTVSGNTHAIFQLHMLPVDFTAKGTVHTHPSGNPTPSQADRELFARFGTTHIIVGRPYDERSWRAYNAAGDPIAMRVVE